MTETTPFMEHALGIVDRVTVLWEKYHRQMQFDKGIDLYFSSAKLRASLSGDNGLSNFLEQGTVIHSLMGELPAEQELYNEFGKLWAYVAAHYIKGHANPQQYQQVSQPNISQLRDTLLVAHPDIAKYVQGMLFGRDENYQIAVSAHASFSEGQIKWENASQEVLLFKKEFVNEGLVFYVVRK